MKVAIHQPAYLPWAGYFQKIIKADCFVYLDTVQYQKNSFQNRNKIRTNDGWCWLTVPVKTKNNVFNCTIKELKINNQLNWQKKHYRSIAQYYKKSKNYEKHIELFKYFYETNWDYLTDLCFEMLVEFNKVFEINTKVIKASDIFNLKSKKSNLVLDICKELGASTYYSGELGTDYLETDEFLENNIKVKFQKYICPQYEQVYPGYIQNLSVIDLMMNVDDPKKYIN